MKGEQYGKGKIHLRKIQSCESWSPQNLLGFLGP